MRVRFLWASLLLCVAGCGGGGGGRTTNPSDPLPDGVKGKWTVLVYMNAANDLYRFSPLNVNQMEQVANNPAVRYVIQWKQIQSKFPNSMFDGTRRYLAYPDNTDTLKSHLLENLGGGVDMGDWQTLRNFVQWGKAHYPADHYVLVIWNHGNGWERKPELIDNGRAVSYDDETHTAIQIWQLTNALTGLGLDTVAFDASLMQMAEVAYELRNVTPLVAGSEESPPGEGYPYHLVFKGYQDNPDATPRQLSKGFVDGMIGFVPYSARKITQSVLDTSQFGNLATSCSELANTLSAHPELSTQIQNARAATQGYSVTFLRHYYDLIDFCNQLSSRVTPTDVLDAAAAAKTATQNAIVWEGHNSNSSGSRGLAVDLSTASQYNNVKDDYQLLSWSQNTTWDEWLKVAP